MYNSPSSPKPDVWRNQRPRLKMTGAVYFHRPHSSQEKGVRGNTDYLIRDMLYPENDFLQLAQREGVKDYAVIKRTSEKNPWL
jgi:hypothetical protein